MSGMLLSSSSSSIQRMQHVNTADPDQLSVASHGTLSLLSAALLVGISYYFGTRIGFAWTPRGWPNSTFWPPNAILLAALLVAPRRAWWMFFLAVLPAHMFAQLQTGVPVWTAAFWFITNSFEAFIGALLHYKIQWSRKKARQRPLGLRVCRLRGPGCPPCNFISGCCWCGNYGLGKGLLASGAAGILHQCIGCADNRAACNGSQRKKQASAFGESVPLDCWSPPC